MALIAIAVYDTEDNDRTWMTAETLQSIKKTVNLVKHRLFIIDNASCEATKKVIAKFCEKIPSVNVITNEENIGTARAINLAWKQRLPGEHLIKMDNDIVVHQDGWVELLEDAIDRDPENIGQAALKRKDLKESPNEPHPFYKSELTMLPHIGGQQWIVAEEVQHCIGSCVMHNYRLIDKVGGLVQFGVYSFDDALMSLRSRIALFKNVFIPSVNIDHIDPGINAYQKQKEEYAGRMMDAYVKAREEYTNGTRNIYHEL